MKNNESVYGHLVFALKVIIVLIIFKRFGWCEVVPDNLIAISFIVVITAMLVALVQDGLTRGILALIDAYEAYKRWRKFTKPVDDSKVRLHWNPKTKEIIQIEDGKNKQ